MLEVEVKYAVPDLTAFEERLKQMNAQFTEGRTDTDHYFNAPDRDFAQTDEALRIRSIGSKNFITYKGPKRDQQTKSRTEFELPLPEGSESAASFRHLLIHLGYRQSGVVRKARRVFLAERDRFRVQICLDQVEGLGSFAELEITADEGHYEAAKSAVLSLASELGLRDSERRSYLQLLLGSA